MGFSNQTGLVNASVIRIFGRLVTIDGTSVTGMFDNQYRTVDPLNGLALEVGHSTTDPVLWVRTDDVPDPTVGVTVSVDGIDYVIRDIEPDGTGITRLVLEAQ